MIIKNPSDLVLASMADHWAARSTEELGNSIPDMVLAKSGRSYSSDCDDSQVSIPPYVLNLEGALDALFSLSRMNKRPSSGVRECGQPRNMFTGKALKQRVNFFIKAFSASFGTFNTKT